MLLCKKRICYVALQYPFITCLTGHSTGVYTLLLLSPSDAFRRSNIALLGHRRSIMNTLPDYPSHASVQRLEDEIRKDEMCEDEMCEDEK